MRVNEEKLKTLKELGIITNYSFKVIPEKDQPLDNEGRSPFCNSECIELEFETPEGKEKVSFVAITTGARSDAILSVE